MGAWAVSHRFRCNGEDPAVSGAAGLGFGGYGQTGLKSNRLHQTHDETTRKTRPPIASSKTMVDIHQLDGYSEIGGLSSGQKTALQSTAKTQSKSCGSLNFCNSFEPKTQIRQSLGCTGQKLSPPCQALAQVQEVIRALD